MNKEKFDEYKKKFVELQKKYPGLSDYITFGRLIEGKLLAWKEFLFLLKKFVPDNDYVQEDPAETEKAILHLWERTARGKPKNPPENPYFIRGEKREVGKEA